MNWIIINLRTSKVMQTVTGQDVTYRTREEAELHASRMSKAWGETFAAQYCD